MGLFFSETKPPITNTQTSDTRKLNAPKHQQ